MSREENIAKIEALITQAAIDGDNVRLANLTNALAAIKASGGAGAGGAGGGDNQQQPSHPAQAAAASPKKKRAEGELSDSEMTQKQVQEYMAANNITEEHVVCVYLLGSSGAGKSLLSDMMLGCEAFEHRAQVKSCTAANTYAMIQMSPTMHALIANIPGLIEAESQNIERNKRCIKEAFAFLRKARAIALFVAFAQNGRPLAQDFQGIRAVCEYVEIDTKAMAVLVNGIEWSRIDQPPPEFRADMEQIVRSVTKRPQLRVEYVSKLANPHDFTTQEAKQLQAQLVALCIQLAQDGAHIMQPKPGAELNLDVERLEKEIKALDAQLSELKKQHQIELQQQAERWKKMVEDNEKRNNERIQAMQSQIKELENRPPKIVHVRGGRSCFDAESSFVEVVVVNNGNKTFEKKKLSDVEIGDVVVAVDKITGQRVESKVILVDKHPGELSKMVQITTTQANLPPLILTEHHIVYRRRVEQQQSNAAVGGRVIEPVLAGALAVGDEVLVVNTRKQQQQNDDSNNTFAKITSIERGLLRQPANIYTRDSSNTVVVNGIACSCLIDSEDYCSTDMMILRALDSLWPGVTASGWFQAVRNWYETVEGNEFGDKAKTVLFNGAAKKLQVATPFLRVANVAGAPRF